MSKQIVSIIIGMLRKYVLTVCRVKLRQRGQQSILLCIGLNKQLARLNTLNYVRRTQVCLCIIQSHHTPKK